MFNGLFNIGFSFLSCQHLQEVWIKKSEPASDALNPAWTNCTMSGIDCIISGTDWSGRAHGIIPSIEIVQSWRHCMYRHAAKMETSTKVTDVQTNGSLHFLGITSITLQKLCKHWGYNDRHWFSCGFSLQYMGPRLYQRSDYLHFNLHRVKFKIQKCFSNGRWPLWFPAISQISPPGLVPEKDGDMRLIHHLFYAENVFINDFIDPTACSVQCYNCYKVDQGAELKTQVGMGAKTTTKKRGKNWHQVLYMYYSLSHRSDYDLLGFRF